MAIYTTYFICPPEDLAGGFPPWREPLSVPVMRERKNPLTGQRFQVLTREPSWDDVGPNWEPELVAISGDYEEYLEKRIPDFVRSCRHWCWKGLTQTELDELAEVLDVGESSLDVALYAHPSTHSTLDRLNATLVDRLAKLDQSEALNVARRWAAVMSGPEFRPSDTSDWEPWKEDYALQLLQELKTLAIVADGRLGVYLLTEW